MVACRPPPADPVPGVCLGCAWGAPGVCAEFRLQATNGGGIYDSYCTILMLTNTVFSSCSASREADSTDPSYGGGVLTTAYSASIVDTTVTGCSSSDNGGGIEFQVGAPAAQRSGLTQSLQ